MGQSILLVARRSPGGFDDPSGDDIEIDEPRQRSMPNILKLAPENMGGSHRHIRMFALQCLHTRQFIHADRAFSSFGPFSSTSVDLTPIANLLIAALHRAPRSANSGSGGVADPLFEQVARMSWRDLLDDTPLHQFLCNFASGPLTDLPFCLHRRFACQGCHLTALLR